MPASEYHEIRLTGDRWALVNRAEGFALAIDDEGSHYRFSYRELLEHIVNLEDGASGWAIAHWAWYFQNPSRLTLLPYPGMPWIKCRLSLEDLKILYIALCDLPPNNVDT